MTRYAAALALATSVALSGARAAGHQQPIFRSGVDAVSVPVSVRKGNAPVAGLTAKDFDLTDSGVPQTITAFSLEALPIDVTLLLHVSSRATYRLEWLKTSVAETYARLKPDDRLRLIAVQHSVREITPFQAGSGKPVLDTLTAAGGTSIYDGLAAAMMRASEPERRQLIVAFTTGLDTISILDQGTAEAVAGLADTVVHVVVPIGGSAAVRKSALADAAAPLGSLVARTGGQIFPTDIDKPIGGAFTQALDEFRTSYVLRYVPSGVPRGGWHDITVTVKVGPYEVRARKGYGG